jgi:hypothetical protein
LKFLGKNTFSYPEPFLRAVQRGALAKSISELVSDWLVLTPDIVFLPCFCGIRLWILCHENRQCFICDCSSLVASDGSLYSVSEVTCKPGTGGCHYDSVYVSTLKGSKIWWNDMLKNLARWNHHTWYWLVSYPVFFVHVFIIDCYCSYIYAKVCSSAVVTERLYIVLKIFWLCCFWWHFCWLSTFAVDSRLFAVDSRLFTLDSRLFTLDFYSRLSTFTLDFYSRLSTFTLDSRPSTFRYTQL